MCIETLSEIGLTIYDSILPDRQIHTTLMQMDVKESIKLFWNGKAYLLSIGIAVTVCVIPFLIFILTFLIFFYPITRKFRERLFNILLWSAKWQLMNGILSVYILAALVINFHEADVFVEVTAKPLFAGNLCIWAPNFLITFVLISHFQHTARFYSPPSRFVYIFQLLFMTFAMTMLYFVYYHKIVRFELSGLTTLILPDSMKVRDESLIDLYNLLPNLFPTNMGFLWNIIAAPACTFILFAFNTITKSRYDFFSSMHTIFSAYSALEVILGINIAVATEMGELSKFLVDYKAEDFCKAQGEYTHLPCLQSTGHMQDATWYLLAALICYFVTLSLPLLSHGCSREERDIYYRDPTSFHSGLSSPISPT